MNKFPYYQENQNVTSYFWCLCYLSDFFVFITCYSLISGFSTFSPSFLASVKSSWPLKNLHSMRRWSTSFTSFLILNSLVETCSPEHNYLGWRINVFRCYVLLYPTVVHTETFLNNPPFFSIPLQLQTTLTGSRQGDNYIDILHRRKYSPHLISPPIHNLDGKPNQDGYFPQ